ncbi:MAG: MBL fold metallo-hydrolase [Anaerolineales bacterium]|nr:MBL fold metallo-hydrolase [Anaerolineales bacterium]MDW8445691.1 MBL fold metallo-hydrolase [Anaerolineales bacterium]
MNDRENCAQASEEALFFQWLGVGGVRLRWRGKVLLIDPFVTRPSLTEVLFRPLVPNAELLRQRLPCADAVLITHAHYDHLMDVPEVVRQTGASAYGSKNAVTLLRAAGVPREKCFLVQSRDRLEIGPFRIEVIEGKHLWLPFFSSKELPETASPPRRVWQYCMDQCFSFLIETDPSFLIWHSIEARGAAPAQVLVLDSEIPLPAFAELADLVKPRLVIPIHWDDFFLPLSTPIKPFFRPPERGALRLRRLDIVDFARKLRELIPSGEVLVPQRFEEVNISRIL